MLNTLKHACQKTASRKRINSEDLEDYCVGWCAKALEAYRDQPAEEQGRRLFVFFESRCKDYARTQCKQFRSMPRFTLSANELDPVCVQRGLENRELLRTLYASIPADQQLILRMLAEGDNMREIAEALGVRNSKVMAVIVQRLRIRWRRLLSLKGFEV